MNRTMGNGHRDRNEILDEMVNIFESIIPQRLLGYVLTHAI